MRWFNMTKRWRVVIAAACLAVIGVGPAPGAKGCTPPQDESGEPFELIWSVAAISGTDWEKNIDVRGVPFAPRFHIVSFLDGLYPVAGPHIPAMDPTYMDRHLAELRRDVEAALPPDYDGFVSIDWEHWVPIWRDLVNRPSSLPADAYDYDYQDDWRDYMRAYRPGELAGLNAEQQEQVFAQTYENAVRDFYTASLQECKRVRPAAKWGFYWYPMVFYWESCYGGDYMAQRRADDDRIAWLWELVDVVYPCLYQGYEADPTLPPRDRFTGCGLADAMRRITPDENRESIIALMDESLRVANGKPVMPFIWARYSAPAGDTGLRMLNDINLAQMVDIPRQMGARGLVLWDYFNTQQESLFFRDFFDRKLGPHLIATASNAARDNVNYRLGLTGVRDNGRRTIVRDDSPGSEPDPRGTRPARIADAGVGAPPAAVPAMAGAAPAQAAARGAPAGQPAAPGTPAAGGAGDQEAVTTEPPAGREPPRRGGEIGHRGAARSKSAPRENAPAPAASPAPAPTKKWDRPPVVLPVWSPPSPAVDGRTTPGAIVMPGQRGTLPPWARTGASTPGTR